MGLLRSDNMHFYQFTCLKDDSSKVIEEMGEMESVEFVDLNK